ncbi:uncharacterized protein NDAI_0I02860 [Naumovozyma dairenensis CBS 421]|uniref:Ty3 transposon capsid-like protein domain-containing protein n=1 Tax=Naumovozyma dairenensis (strain ATCC 10597 / BCRC 20456 / CBS 421 / NBRC 0211 / NRRL Y-12639) TaxID=1071378 RepID=G0WGE3_NAUDC|nr:hypothetical protein NDAI_0I02860 [Naumovozyma dairenensis CBS 421]CCD26854.1 hypothetical protein NDAI_0I02860 [Naumovozyma dairenensis CBS 421]
MSMNKPITIIDEDDSKTTFPAPLLKKQNFLDQIDLGYKFPSNNNSNNNNGNKKKLAAITKIELEFKAFLWDLNVTFQENDITEDDGKIYLLSRQLTTPLYESLQNYISDTKGKRTLSYSRIINDLMHYYCHTDFDKLVNLWTEFTMIIQGTGGIREYISKFEELYNQLPDNFISNNGMICQFIRNLKPSYKSFFQKKIINLQIELTWALVLSIAREAETYLEQNPFLSKGTNGNRTVPSRYGNKNLHQTTAEATTPTAATTKGNYNPRHGRKNDPSNHAVKNNNKYVPEDNNYQLYTPQPYALSASTLNVPRKMPKDNIYDPAQNICNICLRKGHPKKMCRARGIRKPSPLSYD